MKRYLDRQMSCLFVGFFLFVLELADSAEKGLADGVADESEDGAANELADGSA